MKLPSVQVPAVTVPLAGGDSNAPVIQVPETTVDVQGTVDDTVRTQTRSTTWAPVNDVSGAAGDPAPVTGRARRRYARAVPDREQDAFVASLMDTHLYSVGAFFVDSHPELADDVVGQAEAIERTGLERYAEQEAIELEAAFQTLVTGLAVRYYRAVNGTPG